MQSSSRGIGLKELRRESGVVMEDVVVMVVIVSDNPEFSFKNWVLLMGSEIISLDLSEINSSSLKLSGSFEEISDSVTSKFSIFGFGISFCSFDNLSKRELVSVLINDSFIFS